MLLYSFKQAGNRKNVKIVNDDWEIAWIKTLEDEVYSRNWLEPPTIMLTLDLNFFNTKTGILMDTKIVVMEASGGLYSLEIDTNYFTSDFGHKTKWHYVSISLGLALCLVLMITTCCNVKRDRRDQRILNAAIEDIE